LTWQAYSRLASAVVAFPSMNLPLGRQRVGKTGRGELGKLYEALRDLVAERRVSRVAGWGRQGKGLAKSVGRSFSEGADGLWREAPGGERRIPVKQIVLAGAALGLIATAAVALSDRRRRQAIQRRIGEVSSAARERYTQLGGVSGAVQTFRSRAHHPSSNGSELRGQVIQAIESQGEMPTGLQIQVEGRTVYLEGQVVDPAAADVAAERAHSVSGVVAVVNHTTTAPRSS
jgi:BON domain